MGLDDVKIEDYDCLVLLETSLSQKQAKTASSCYSNNLTPDVVVSI